MHQLNPAGLLVHLQRQYNPSVLPVHSQRCTYNPTGLPVRSQKCIFAIFCASFVSYDPSMVNALQHGTWMDVCFSALVSLCVHRDALTIPLGSLCVHRNAPLPTPNQDAPHNLSSPSRVLCSSFYTTYLKRDSTAQRVCSPGAGFNPPEFWSPCGLPVSCCLATSVVRSRLVAPLRALAGPAWSSLAQDL